MGSVNLDSSSLIGALQVVLTDLQTQAIQRLPRTTQVWQGDLRSLDAMATVQGIAGGLTGVFWVDEATATPRSIHPCVVTQDHQRPELMLEGLVEALLSPVQGTPGKPRQIIVCRREYQLYLRGALQAFGIQVEYRPQLRLLDDILLFLAEHLSQDQRFLPQGKPPDDLPEDQILKPNDLILLQELYRQAVSLWRRAPWDYLEENPTIAITLNQWGVKTLQACILGGGGLLVGVVFYYSLEDFNGLLEDPRDDGLKLLSYDALYVHFLAEDEVNPALVQQFAAYGWPQPNRDTYTDVGRLVKDQGLRSLGQTEVWVVQSALAALNLFLSKYKRALNEGNLDPIKYVATVAHPQDTGKLKVQLAYTPLPTSTSALDSWGGAVRDDLFPDGMSVLYEVLPWALIDTLQHTAATARLSPRALSTIRTEGCPVLILTLKARAARKLCDQLLAENLLGIVFAYREVDGERVDFTLAVTQVGGVYLVLDVEDDLEHQAEIEYFQKAQRACGGGHGVLIVKDTKGKQFNPRDVVGLFQCSDVVDLKLGTIPLE